MLISDSQARKLLLSLYNVAAKDANDIIANAASALAVRLELPRKAHALTELEARIVRYATQNSANMNVGEVKQQRKTYKRRVSLA